MFLGGLFAIVLANRPSFFCIYFYIFNFYSMKHLFIFILLLFLSPHLPSQNTFNKALFFPPENTCEGFSMFDGSDGGLSILPVKDNNYIIVGGGKSPEHCNQQNIKIWKTNINGEIISQKVHGGIEQDAYSGYWGNDLKTSDGGIFIAGSVNHINSGLNNILLMKLDSEGNIIFEKTYGGELSDIGYAGEQLPDGGFVITGSTRSFDGASENNANIFLLRTDAEGNELWHKTFGGTRDDVALSLDIAADGGFLIGGKRGQSLDQKRTYVVKTDSMGVYQWGKQYDERLWDGCSALLRSTKDGGFVMTSCTYVEEYNQHHLGLNFEICYIAKANHLGNIIWRIFPSTEHSVFISTLREMEDGSIIGVGTWSYGKSTAPYGYIIKLSAEGDFLWERIIYYNEFSFNRFRDFQQTEDGGLIMTGTTWNPERWHQDLWLVKVGADGCLSEEFCDSLTTDIQILDPSELSPPKLFPNPTQSHLQIQIPTHFTSKSLQLQLTNIEGRVVLKEWIEDGKQLDIADLAAGIYIATWLQDGQALKREKVVVLE